MSNNSLLFSLFSGGVDSRAQAQEEHELRLERNEHKIQAKLEKMRKDQSVLSRDEQKHLRAINRAVKRGDHIEARRCAQQAAQTRKQIELLEKAQAPLIKACESAFYARQNIGVNGSVEETIKAIEESNQLHTPQHASRMLPAAMRAGQTLKTVSDQYRDASSELNEALEYSDDEEEELREDANRIMETDPTAVFTTTNPEALLRYAYDNHSLQQQEQLSQHNTRRARDASRSTRRAERAPRVDQDEEPYFRI